MLNPEKPETGSIKTNTAVNFVDSYGLNGTLAAQGGLCR